MPSWGADEGSRIVPVAFMHNAGKFYTMTNANTRKISNIRVRSKVAFCIDVDKDPMHLMAVVGKGRARILPQNSKTDEIRKQIIIYLVGSLDHPIAKSMLDSDHVIVEITPTRMTSWKNAFERQKVMANG